MFLQTFHLIPKLKHNKKHLLAPNIQMATNDQESRVPLKLLVDDKKKRVIAAEANNDFVDILLSFLSFPIGTTIRLTKNNSQPMPKISTCINNVYQSVENIDVNRLYTENCKSMLLNPRNPCIEDCLKLKVKIDDSVSNKYFRCCYCSSKSWLVNVRCNCGGKTSKEIFSDVTNPTNDYSGVFLGGGIGFIISDDLRVLPGSPSSLVQLFSDLGYNHNHMNEIKEMYVEVGKEAILRLLTCSLISKSPLTEVFMNKQAIVDNNVTLEPRISQFMNKQTIVDNNVTLEPRFYSAFGGLQTASNFSINLKLILSKSRNKILYAEAKDSFVDFLFSFLTFPLGSVIHVLKGVSGVGCIDNLYKSVTDLESQWFPNNQYKLLNPGVAPRHECQQQLLPISVRYADGYLIDPRDTHGRKDEFGRFAKSPSLFIVLDDLEVKPMCSTSSFGLLKELNVPLFDIKEEEICIGKAEAQCLLQAALIGSSSALTIALSPFLSTKKEEVD